MSRDGPATLRASQHLNIAGGIGGSPSTPAELVRRMAMDPDRLLRRQAARSPNLDRELAERLAADPEANVRYYLASNKSLDTDLLEILARDSSRSVRAEAAKQLAERGVTVDGD